MSRRFKMESVVNMGPGNKLLFRFDGGAVAMFRNGREITEADLTADEYIRLAEESGYFKRLQDAGRAA